MIKKACIFIVIVLFTSSFMTCASGERVFLMDKEAYVSFINNSDLTKDILAKLGEDSIHLTLTKGAKNPSFALPIDDMDIDPSKDMILAICLKTTYRTFEYDYAYAYFETDSATGYVTANSYAVSAKWQVIYFRMGSNMDFSGQIKSIRIEPFEESPDKEEDLLYKIKWLGFFQDINEAQTYSNQYLKEINPSPEPQETVAPHKTQEPIRAKKDEKTGWGFVWTIVAMVLVSATATYFIEKQRRKEESKSKGKSR